MSFWINHFHSSFGTFYLNCITTVIFLHLSKSHSFLKVNPRSVWDKFIYLLQALITHLPHSHVSIFALCGPLEFHEYKSYSPQFDYNLIFIRIIHISEMDPEDTAKKQSRNQPLPSDFNSRAMLLFQVRVTLLQWCRTKSMLIYNRGKLSP